MHMPKKSQKTPTPRSFSTEHIEQFQLFMYGRGLSENTVLSYTKDIKSFLTECAGIVGEDEYTELAVVWLGRQRKTHAPKTVTRHLTSLKQFAQAMRIPHQLNDYRAPRPMAADPHPLPEGIAGVFAMLEAAGTTELEGLISLCGLCGLRIGEALTVRATMIESSSRTLRVRGKGDKERRVPINSHAWEYLETLFIRSNLRSNSLFFPWPERGARKLITECGERAGISRRVSSHDLRATFATHVYRETKDIRVVQALLGHSSVATTQVYLGVSQQDLAQAVAVINR